MKITIIILLIGLFVYLTNYIKQPEEKTSTEDSTKDNRNGCCARTIFLDGEEDTDIWVGATDDKAIATLETYDSK